MTTTKFSVSFVDYCLQKAGKKIASGECKVKELPYSQAACISGLRVFGIGAGMFPEKVKGIRADLISELDLFVTWNKSNAVGYNVLWG